ncbi:MAG: aminopeptidase [Candidatus Nomurabacteria bacterium]|jgi:aminopeptidase|nr:aminopeptidase [Candidatus Nomurabacteria bacterium]
MKNYQPTKEIIEKYAKVLVNFALGGGKGIKKGDVVWVGGSEASRPLYLELLRQVWLAGGHPIGDYSHDIYEPADNTGKFFYEHASEAQLDFFARDYYRGMVKQIDHDVTILADTDLEALKGVDPAKIMRRGQVHKPLHDWQNKKEGAGKFTWTLGLYGTAAMAREAGLSLEEYWQQIIKACFLDEADPIAKWRSVEKEIGAIRGKLDDLKMEWVRVQGKDVDLKLKIGADRKWEGGGGRNIPSFEIFTSPDWRGTTGWIRFNQPLYRYGNLIEGVELEFKNGKVIKSKASKNQKVLQEMIATKNADKVGEFSLTDSRFSRITKFMAETLYDENMGGRYGNTHIALGTSYHDCFAGDQSKPTKSEWARRGFNDSVVHTDIVSTTDRTVTATLADGTERVIYEDGKFVV